jgi:SAM-dependent methyltransferase
MAIGKKRGSLFGPDFFDGGIESPATYATYTMTSIFSRFEEEAKRLKRMFSPSSVLDIGCAKGFLVLVLRNLGIESHGVDISEYALSQAPEHVRPYLMMVDLDSESLPYPDARFDLVTAYSVLELLESLPNVLNEICRVTRNGGALHVETGYEKYYAGAGQYLFRKYGYKLHDERFWIRQLESHCFKYDRRLSDEYFHEWIGIDAAVARGGGPKLKAAALLNSHAIGRRILLKFGKRKSKIGILCFRVHKP